VSVAIRLSGVSKTFTRPETGTTEVVLRDISLAVAPNELVALVGPSGSGKTTLLNLIAQLHVPDTGTVALTRADGRTPRLSMVFQQPRLLEWRTVTDNVRLAAAAAGIARDRVGEALDAVGLAAYADAFPLMLSGGQRQRVALARAFVVEPDVVLFDEPFSALDELTARTLRSAMQTLRAQRPHTGVLVTHNTLEAAFLADRIVSLGAHPGRIVDEERVAVPRPRDPDDERLFRIHQRVLRALGV
jgi:NitT/TauT family transport system ATP-binding protein